MSIDKVFPINFTKRGIKKFLIFLDLFFNKGVDFFFQSILLFYLLTFSKCSIESIISLINEWRLFWLRRKDRYLFEEVPAPMAKKSLFSFMINERTTATIYFPYEKYVDFFLFFIAIFPLFTSCTFQFSFFCDSIYPFHPLHVINKKITAATQRRAKKKRYPSEIRIIFFKKNDWHKIVPTIRWKSSFLYSVRYDKNKKKIWYTFEYMFL